MQGAVFFGDRKAGLREFPEPEPGPGEVVVAVRASGMCGSDLHYYRSTPGSTAATSGQVIMGHEPAGVVHAVGPGRRPSHDPPLCGMHEMRQLSNRLAADVYQGAGPILRHTRARRSRAAAQSSGRDTGPTGRLPQLRRGCSDRLRYRHGLGRPRPGWGMRKNQGGGFPPGPGWTVRNLARHRKGSESDRD